MGKLENKEKLKEMESTSWEDRCNNCAIGLLLPNLRTCSLSRRILIRIIENQIVIRVTALIELSATHAH